MNPLLLYLHGFLSSPRADKARAVAAHLDRQGLAVDYQVPLLPPHPRKAYSLLRTLLDEEMSRGRRDVALIGSSLGGFYATVLAAHYRLRAVLVNPAVAPHTLLASRLGVHHNPHTGERFVLNRAHMAQLRSMAPVAAPAAARLYVLLQTGDETLDYRQARDFYAACPQKIEQGGSHRFENFPRHLPAVCKFLQLR